MTKTAVKMSFDQACKAFTNRYTGEHKPVWARGQTSLMQQAGTFYAPPYATDADWYANTTFPPQNGRRSYCDSTNPSWPLGQWLDAPYTPRKGGI